MKRMQDEKEFNNLKNEVYSKELYEHRIKIDGADYDVYLTAYSNISSYSDVYDFLGNKRYACSGCYNDEGDRDIIIAVDVNPETELIRLFYGESNSYHYISADDITFSDSATKIL